MITKKYYKLIRVSYADEGYFCITNVSNSIGTVSIGTVGSINYEYSTDGVTWTSYTGGTDINVDPNSNIYWRYAGSGSKINDKTFNLGFDCYASGNLMSLFSKTDFASYTGDWTANGLFLDQTHLLKADFNFGSQTEFNKFNQCNSLFSGCINLTSIPDFSGFTAINNASGSVTQIFDNAFKNCQSLVVGANFSSITSWPRDAGEMSNIYNGCTALRTVFLPNIENFGNYRLYSWSAGMPTGVNGVIYKNANATVSGVPAGWTTQNY